MKHQRNLCQTLIKRSMGRGSHSKKSNVLSVLSCKPALSLSEPSKSKRLNKHTSIWKLVSSAKISLQNFKTFFIISPSGSKESTLNTSSKATPPPKSSSLVKYCSRTSLKTSLRTLVHARSLSEVVAILGCEPK